MASIDQNRHSNPLPDFRNLGVILRILVIVALMAVLGAATRTATVEGWIRTCSAAIALALPVTMLSLLVLGALAPWLRQMQYVPAVAAVTAVALGSATVVAKVAWTLLDGGTGASLAHYWLLTAAAALLIVGYFNLRNRALSPALTEARLQALQARIRPHFFFNSLNAVISLVRSEPRRAEEALEDLAELFRVLMADNRDLIPLSREIEICRQYLAIEHLRLGERLKVDWRIDRMPPDAMVPPLVLQPLLENAVYHGIEPLADPGSVTIEIRAEGNVVHISLRNPARGESRQGSGNRMALANIRERLQLHFDAEASLTTRTEGGVFEARIRVPYVKGKR
ncbi:MAG TPA: sensor histidine kinase [Burkholderiales bacterium]|nr:sensor histidine kinase [Burkholderiales bacterium]